MEFDEHHAYESAKQIVRAAIDNYPQPGQDTVIPQIDEALIAGFSHEYIRYMQGGHYRGSFRPLNDAIAAGRIRGLAAVVGCNNAARARRTPPSRRSSASSSRNDVLVAVTGCAATGAAKYGYLRPEFMDQGRRRASRGVRGHRHPAGAARRLLRGQLPHPHHPHRMRH